MSYIAKNTPSLSFLILKLPYVMILALAMGFTETGLLLALHCYALVGPSHVIGRLGKGGPGGIKRALNER